MFDSLRAALARLRSVPLLAVVAVAIVATRGATSALPVGQDDVLKATLRNGLRVVIVRNALAPVVSTNMTYLVGSRDDPADVPGMAHAQEHMMFRGTHDLATAELGTIATALGGSFNAETSQTLTQYEFTVPASDLETVFHIEADRMRDVLDAQSQWQIERGAIEQEIARDESSPGADFYRDAQAFAFAGTPYAHDGVGTRSAFARLTGPRIKAFYRRWYAPNNAVLVVAGDVEPQATLATIKSLYGSIPAHPVPERPAVELQPVKAETFALESDLPYVLSFTGYRLPGTSDPDYAAAQVLVDVLASQRADVYGLTVAGKALQTGAQFSANYPKASLALVYGALPVGSDVAAFDKTLAGVVAGYASSGVPAELVDAAKRAEAASAQYERNSITNLASTWSQAIADEGRNSPDDDVAAIAKVTVADVDRVAKKYLAANLAVTANLIPKPSGKAVSSKGFGGGETVTSAPTKPVVLPDWARTKLAKLEVAPSRLAPSDTTLPNGIRLIVQPESASDTVTVVGQIRHSDALQTPRGKEGAGTVLDGLFSYGTTSLDRLAYQKALDDVAAQISAGPEFSLHVLAADFDRGTQLLADDELPPALPADAFAVVRKQTADSVAGERQSPSYFVQRAVSRALLPANDPELREPTPASVGALTRDDIAAFHRAVYRPDMTTIVVSGKITSELARSTIERYFGGWSASGPRPNVDLPTVPPNKRAAAVVPDSSRVQDETHLVETVALKRTDPDYYALQLGDHVLGGGFYATRLYHDLRQVAGLVYNVNNRLTAGRTRSTYSVSFGSDPDKVSRARALAVRDLRAMQTTDVSPGELSQAKAILLRQLPLGEASVDGVANALAGRSTAGLHLDEAHRAAVTYERLTAADVRRAFARYVRPNDFVQVVQGPTPH
ncbi:MAG: pitrilysin family protein [Vulcanimicrobiaceae bacterium]